MSWKDFVYRKAIALKAGTEDLVYGRDLLRDWAASLANNDRQLRILDIGCGYGNDLLAIREKLGGKAELFGLEGYAPYRDDCAKVGIDAKDGDVERDRLPYEDGSLDVVLMNQVLEHCKDIFWIFSEVHRVLRPGGLFLAGTPNLAAWHDRLMLLVGMQPSGMKVLGPHLRGYTRPGMKAFAEADGYFKLTGFGGSGFYPFPRFCAVRFAKWFPTLATGIFFRMEKSTKSGTFLDVLRTRMFETAYYTGPAA
ncbi:MAG: class I SAM-dependent methyltransferase [Fibrobacterota bacterium]